MKPKTKTLLFILVSFVLGGAAGYLADEAGLFGRGRGAHYSTKDYRQQFHRRLELDSTQVRSVDSLLDAYRERMNVQRDAMMRERDTLRSEIRRLLLPRQLELHEAMMREMDGRYGMGRRDSIR
ncbi:MAG: hypothetical protein AABY75_07865 [Bacteroidota bacterium]